MFVEMKQALLTCCLAAAILALAPVMFAQIDDNTRAPALIRYPVAPLPKEARAGQVWGRVTVRVLVGADGRVAAVLEIKGPGWRCPDVSDPIGSSLRRAARESAFKAKFEPATRDGQPVEAVALIDFDFHKPPVEENRLQGQTPVHVKGSAAERFEQNAMPPLPPPPPPPSDRSVGGVLNGKAVSLPRPTYPAEARATKVWGQVVVQVLIDENGAVMSAEPTTGDPLLRQTAQEAACKAKFSPTLLSGQPVKVSGVITYNFRL